MKELIEQKIRDYYSELNQVPASSRKDMDVKFGSMTSERKLKMDVFSEHTDEAD
jgi:hypothetical protein